MNKLKTFLLAAGICLSSTVTPAAEDLYSVCRSGDELAMLVMQSRQAGFSTEDLLELTKSSHFAMSVVLYAEEYPVVSEESLKRKIILEFIDVTFERCYYGEKL